VDDHQKALFVNELTEITLRYGNTQQLRQRISTYVNEHLEGDSDEIEEGHKWFNAYQKVNDFLFGELRDRFPTESNEQETNTIEAIKTYANDKVIDSHKPQINYNY